VRRLSNTECYDKLTTAECFIKTVSQQDKNKVLKARAGINPTTPSSKIGQVAAELGLRAYAAEQPGPPPPDPEPPPPEPLPGGELNALWKRDAVFTVALSSFAGDARAEAKAQGFSVVYVQLLHMASPEANNEGEIPVFVRDGWTVCGWGTYGQGSDPRQDGHDAAAIVKRLNLAGWKANGEAWAEGQDSWKTQAFLEGWNANDPGKPLGWSVLSSDTANFARPFAYGVALSEPGSDIDIQVYGSTYPTYTVGAGLGMLSKAGVPVSRTTMTFDVTAEGIGPFNDYRTWAGPRRVWTGDTARAFTFQQLAR
jgi:hypothetical protein